MSSCTPRAGNAVIVAAGRELVSRKAASSGPFPFGSSMAPAGFGCGRVLSNVDEDGKLKRSEGRRECDKTAGRDGEAQTENPCKTTRRGQAIIPLAT
jgi:hypothetical protein